MRPGNNDRNALSLEPTADYGKRWEDLIDAADQAASAAGDIDEDRTPVSWMGFQVGEAWLIGHLDATITYVFS